MSAVAPQHDDENATPSGHAFWSDRPLEASQLNPAGKWAQVEWARIAPFIAMHLGCLAVFWVGVSWVAVAFAAALYVVRMFFITGFYHRYFSHRSFKTGRLFQAVMAVMGLTAIQRGPLWWAAHHRHHHRHADEELDLHSPGVWGTLWAHMFWFTTEAAYATRARSIPDLAKYPELVWLNRFEIVIYVAFGMFCFGFGWAGESLGWGITGWQAFVWGFCVSTVLLYHGTYTINSLAHRLGTRRYATRDDSRNNWWLAVITLGEGWHNNHHHYPGSARQGFFWWEIDLTYWGLKALERLKLIGALHEVPPRRLTARRIDLGTPDPLGRASARGAGR